MGNCCSGNGPVKDLPTPAKAAPAPPAPQPAPAVPLTAVPAAAAPAPAPAAAAPAGTSQTAAAPAAPASGPGAAPKDPPAQPKTPNPGIPFAVLRNAHEGLRAGIKELSEKAAAGDAAAFKAAWADYQRALGVHARTEDHEVFAILDELGNEAVKREHIRDEHDVDHENVHAVGKALESGDAAALQSAFEAWKAYHLEHLKHEEKIMPPIVAKIGGSSWDGRAAAFYELVVKPTDAREGAEFDFFVGYIVRQLTERGSTENTPVVAARVFAHGLKASSDAEQWARWMPVVKANTTPEIWEVMAKEYFLDQPGIQGKKADGAAPAM